MMKPIDEDEPNIVYSKYCQEMTRDGVHIESKRPLNPT